MNVQGKASVDQGKETSDVISAVVADLVKGNDMETEKKLLSEKETETETEMEKEKVIE